MKLFELAMSPVGLAVIAVIVVICIAYLRIRFLAPIQGANCCEEDCTGCTGCGEDPYNRDVSDDEIELIEAMG